MGDLFSCSDFVIGKSEVTTIELVKEDKVDVIVAESIPS